MCGQKFDFIFLFQFIHSASKEEKKIEMNVIIITFIVIFWILL